MDIKTKLIIKVLTGLLTIYLIFIITSFVLNHITSIVSAWGNMVNIQPGWHTTIYPPGSLKLFLTVFILLASLLAVLIYKSSFKLFVYIWLKMFPLHSK